MIDIRLIYDRFTAYPSYLPLITKYPFMCKIWGKGVYLYNKTKNHYMKKIKITFGTGKDSVRHIIDVNHPDELRNFLSALQGAGWNLSEITSIVGGWTF